jgi:RimJ/RimL family protein N-acetyltransferase
MTALLLQGDGFLLRSLVEGDFGLIAAASKSDIPDWTFVPRNLDEAAARAWVAKRLEAGGAIRLVIEVDGAPVGIAGANQPHAYDPGMLEEFYFVLPEFRRRGLASAALRLLSEHAERVVPELRRLQLHVIEGNPGSGRVAELAGFVHESVIQNHLPAVNGFGPRDAAVYGRVFQRA